MREAEPGTRTGSEAHTDAGERTDAEMERKYPVAMALYGILAVLTWFTIGAGNVIVFGRPVEIRFIPLLILATFAFRTMMAMQAERIRRGKGSS
jgi:hypothetical protein